MQKVSEGRRESKRAQTRRRIADAAIDLALERGIEGATVEAISAAADVSPRTFFNYFETKDDALLGAPDARELAAQIEQTVAGAADLSLRELAVRLFADRIVAGIGDGTRHRRRHELAQRHPHLYATAFRSMADAQGALATALRSVAAERGAAEPTSPADPTEPAWADVLVAAAVGAVRAAVMENAADDAAPQTTDLEDRANAILSSTWEMLK